MIEALPFAAQAAVMVVDEFYCHRRRTLRRWERLGHPLDTLAFTLSLGFLLMFAPSPTTRAVYVGLALVSCVLVSKDEWEHGQRCSGFENWLHALLFMLHPVVLIWAGWMWWHAFASWRVVVGATAGMSFLFMLYQFAFWNLWRRHDQQ